MNLATKAALYNALFFPGWGHFYLKKYKRGIMIILPVLAVMLSICWSVVQVAINILTANPFKKGAIDITAVIKLSMDSAKAIGEQGVVTPCSISFILLFIVLLWIFSIIDAYQLGKKHLQETTTFANQL
jgi:hypothetical protein